MKILDFIEQQGKGKYHCYKTRKLSLDIANNDTIAYNYDDKTVSNSSKSDFAESDRTRKSVVDLSKSVCGDKIPPPIFSYFLDGSRHTYKVDDIAIGRKIFPIIAGQVIVGCCERINRNVFKKALLSKNDSLCSKIVIAMPDDFDDNDGCDNFCRAFRDALNSELLKSKFIDERNLTIFRNYLM